MADDRFRIVIDTNILVSALVFGGQPGEVLKLAINGRVKAVTSTPLLLELAGVLTNKFRYSEQRNRAIETKLRQISVVVVPSQKVTILGTADDRVLETALAGRCSYIVTGDRELLELGNFEGVKIINLHEFIAIFS